MAEDQDPHWRHHIKALRKLVDQQVTVEFTLPFVSATVHGTLETRGNRFYILLPGNVDVSIHPAGVTSVVGHTIYITR